MNNNYGLVYPSQDSFYNVDVTNNNFSRLADGIDAAKSGGEKASVIVAAFNSKSPLKSCADFTCGIGDCISVLNSAMEKVQNGGEVLMLDGDYYINSRFFIEKSICLRGMGGRHTRIRKHEESSESILLYLRAEGAVVSGIGIYTDECAEDSHGIFVTAAEAVIENCRFKMAEALGHSVYTNIYLSNLGGFIRINGCVFDKFKDERYNILGDGSWYGTVYGNYCINSNSKMPMPVRINLYDDASYENLSIGAQKTELYVGGRLKA